MWKKLFHERYVAPKIKVDKSDGEEEEEEEDEEDEEDKERKKKEREIEKKKSVAEKERKILEGLLEVAVETNGEVNWYSQFARLAFQDKYPKE